MATDAASPNSTLFQCPSGLLSNVSQVLLIILHSFCCVVAVGGNILVLLAIYKTRSLRKSSMYFLSSLSCADLLVGAMMNPLYILIVIIYNYEEHQLPSPNFFRIITKIENFVWVQTLTATTFSLCAVSIDRFVAVTYSLRYQELVTNRRCVFVVAFIWLFSYAFAATLFLYKDFESREIFWVICSILTVGIPFLVIMFCYTKMALAARRQLRIIHELSVGHSARETRSPGGRESSPSNRKATITAMIVGGMFFLLFFPGMVIFALLLVTQDECYALELNVVWMWAAIISFLHSAFNPWIYCIRVREFRRAFRKLLCGRD